MIQKTDWNSIWADEMKAASMWKRRGGMDRFWDRMADRYELSVQRSDRVSDVISKLKISPEDTVLDIGSGPGTFALPIAGVADHVTAVEPSAGMLSILKKNAQQMKINNIKFINKKWEDVVPFEDVEKHDVTIASYSLDVVNLCDAINKIVLLSNKYVYLFTFAGRRSSDYQSLWPRLYNEMYRPSPDYICLYNVLYDMGILANVEISEYEYIQRYSSMDEAVSYWVENLNERSPEAELVIRNYLASNLVDEEGSLLSKRIMKSAMISWRMDNISVP